MPQTKRIPMQLAGRTDGGVQLQRVARPITTHYWLDTRYVLRVLHFSAIHSRSNCTKVSVMSVNCCNFLIFNADIDECALGTHNCSKNAYCNNTEYNYTCTCNKGYCGDGCICVKDKGEGKVEIV